MNKIHHAINVNLDDSIKEEITNVLTKSDLKYIERYVKRSSQFISCLI